MTRVSPANPALSEAEVLEPQAVDAERAAQGPGPMATAAGAARAPAAKRTFMDRLDAYVSRLSSRNNFWNRVCSLIWLPYAFKSGIRMKRIDSSTFTAVLPF